MIIGGMIYWFGTEKIENELQLLHQKHVKQQAGYLNSQLQEVEMKISHAGFDLIFNNSLDEIDFIKEFKTTHNFTQNLFMLQDSNPLISKSFLYIDSKKRALFNPEYNEVKNKRDVEQLQSLISHKRNINWQVLPEYIMKQKGRSGLDIGLIHNIPSGSGQTDSALIIKLDHDKVTQLVRELSPYHEGAAFLVENDQLITATNSIEGFQYDHLLKKKILEQKSPNGSFIYEWNSRNYSVSFGEINRLNNEWTYISISPMTFIVQPIILLSKLIILISVSAFILSVVITWFATRKMYSPLEELMKVLAITEGKKWSGKKKNEFKLIEEKWHELTENRQQLQTQVITHIPELKSGFIMQLIQGHLGEYTEDDLTKRMESYGWNVNSHSFIIMDVQLTGLQHIKGSFSQSEDSTIAFIASNVIKELAEEQFRNIQMLNFHDFSFGILILEEKTIFMNESLTKFADIVTKAMNEILNLQVTITIGERTSKVKEIQKLYEKVKHGKRLRLFENRNQVIQLQEEEESKLLTGIHYPFSIEKQLIKAIRMEQTGLIEDLLTNFIEELIANETKEINIQQGIVHLFNTIQGEIMQSGFHPYEVFEGKDIANELMRHREPNKIIHCLMNEVVGPYLKKLQRIENREQKILVEQVIMKMMENYMDDISLELYADEINTNPYTLSKAFKQVAGINFIDYLTDLRMDKAKELLASTDLKISDISEQVGYRHSYFNRIFKKQVGLTPSQYRQDQRIIDMQKSTIAGK